MVSFLRVNRLDQNRVHSSPEGPLTVVKEISFDMRPGDSISIVGPSGSGKTTLLGVCAGLDQALLGQRDL